MLFHPLYLDQDNGNKALARLSHQHSLETCQDRHRPIHQPDQSTLHWDINYIITKHTEIHTNGSNRISIIFDPPQATRELFPWQPPLGVQALDCRTTADEIWEDDNDLEVDEDFLL